VKKLKKRKNGFKGPFQEGGREKKTPRMRRRERFPHIRRTTVTRRSGFREKILEPGWGNVSRKKKMGEARWVSWGRRVGSCRGSRNKAAIMTGRSHKRGNETPQMFVEKAHLVTEKNTTAFGKP